VSDIDIRYLRPFSEALIASLRDADMALQAETNEGGANIGQMVIRCSAVTWRFFETVFEEHARTGEWEQAIINRLLPTLSHRLLPPAFANTKTGFRPSMYSFHAIGTYARQGRSSMDLKREQFQKLSAYLGELTSTPMITSTNDREAPYTVAIVAMGPSRNEYIAECSRQSSRFRVADETWAINAMAGVIQHDRAIIMDALPYFAKAAREHDAHQGYADWLRTHPGPIYTQRRYEGFPGSVAYPLEDVLNTLRYPYFNNTCAYAIGLAIHLGVRHLKLYGMDFTYANNRGFAEAGRACCEFWLREATWRKIKVTIAASSTLMDQGNNRPLYGYSVPPKVEWEDGRFRVSHPPAVGAMPERSKAR
jgi:hypothetical protein